MAQLKRWVPRLVQITKLDAVSLALSDIHLLRMLVRASGEREIPVIMKGYGYAITPAEAKKLSVALKKKMEIGIQDLVALFNSLEVPKSIPPEVQEHFRGEEWTGPGGGRKIRPPKRNRGVSKGKGNQRK